MNKTKQLDLYQEVTDKMISLLEKGVSPWQCPWNSYGYARNYATGHKYTGINSILMNLTGHPIPYFMTYNQVKKLDGFVRKGAKSEMVLFYTTYFKDGVGKTISQNDYQWMQDQDINSSKISFLKYFRVFNIANIQGIDFDISEVELQAHETITNCEEVIKEMPHPPQFVFEDANQAYYKPKSDTLNMPDIKQFKSSESYYATLFHELTHSTGHKSRIGRKGITALDLSDKKQYSQEELIAEMGSSFLSAHTGISKDFVQENSASYIKGWLSVLKGDKKAVFKASAQAQKAVDYILSSKKNINEKMDANKG